MLIVMSHRAGYTILESFLGGIVLAVIVGFIFTRLELGWPVVYALSIIFWLIGVFGIFHLLHTKRTR